MDLNVKLQVFEGPLDLLLHLIDKNKVNIYDIPIVEITNQYMEYIAEMKRRDLNVLSEFLVMAATLIEIKCRMLLPREVNEEGEEEDPRADLVQQLLEYKMYKYMSFELKDKQMVASRAYYKGPSIPKEIADYREPFCLEEVIGDLTLQKLNHIFQDIMKRQEERIDPIRSKFGNVEKDEVSIDEKQQYIFRYLSEHSTCSFRQLLEKQGSKMEMIVSFLVILELMKMGQIQIQQENLFDDIIISRTNEDTPLSVGEDFAIV